MRPGKGLRRLSQRPLALTRERRWWDVENTSDRRSRPRLSNLDPEHSHRGAGAERAGKGLHLSMIALRSDNGAASSRAFPWAGP